MFDYGGAINRMQGLAKQAGEVNPYWPLALGLEAANSVKRVFLDPVVTSARNLAQRTQQATQGQEADPGPVFADILNLGITGAAIPKPAASVGVFGGRLAKTANLEKLAQAEAMEKAGAYPDQVWQATGWGRGADNKWRFEIPDQPARVGIHEKGWGGGITQPLENVIAHPQLFEAYPELGQLQTKIQHLPAEGGTKGAYTARDPILEELGEPEQIFASGETEPSMRGTLLHEIQHAIQAREGFARGGSPGQFQEAARGADEAIGRVNQAMTLISRKMDAINARRHAPGRPATDDEELARLKASYDRLMSFKLGPLMEKTNPYEHYRRLAGEVEARNVTSRMNEAPEDLTEPVFGEDVPRSKQIVRFRDNTFQASAEPAPPFHSVLARTVEASPLTKAPAEQWLGTIRNTPGVKQEEMDWIGVEDWLKEQKGPVSKEQVSEFVRSNQVDVQEVVKGQPRKPLDQQAREQKALELYEKPFSQLRHFEQNLVDDAISPPAGTKFEQYQLPGGENYRELLLTLPPRGREVPPSVSVAAERAGLEPGELTIKDIDDMERMGLLSQEEGMDAVDWIETGKRGTQFRSGHFDEPNVLAHVRFNDRVDANGKKTLFIEEVQSDWHQKGRKQGYGEQRPDTTGWTARQDPAFKSWHVKDADGNHVQTMEGVSAEDAIATVARNRTRQGVPDAPFKTAWPELALKRMVKWAADNGYDQVAWTPGKVQAARYDLSKQIKRVEYSPDTGKFRAYSKHDDTAIKREGVKPEQLADRIGKEAAEKLMAQEGRDRVLTGLDLQVGGEGMQAFYDKMLPAAANKLGKKFGTRVVGTKITTGDVKGFDIENVGANRWRVVDLSQNEGHGTFIGPIHTSGADAEAWLKAQGKTDANVWAMPITDAMRSKVRSEGMPLFADTSFAGILMNAIGGQE